MAFVIKVGVSIRGKALEVLQTRLVGLFLAAEFRSWSKPLLLCCNQSRELCLTLDVRDDAHPDQDEAGGAKSDEADKKGCLDVFHE